MTESNEFCSYYSGFWGGKAFRFLDYAKLRMIRKILSGGKSPLRIVDLGCGSGTIALQVARSVPGAEIICVDDNPDLLELVRNRGLEVCRSNLNDKLPFNDDSVDVVLMVDSVEHVESRKQIFSEARRVLTDKGLMIVFTPPYDTIAWYLGEKVQKVLVRRKAGHISPFTRESLEWLLGLHFQAWRVGYINGGLTMYGIGENKK